MQFLVGKVERKKNGKDFMWKLFIENLRLSAELNVEKWIIYCAIRKASTNKVDESLLSVSRCNKL